MTPSGRNRLGTHGQADQVGQLTAQVGKGKADGRD